MEKITGKIGLQAKTGMQFPLPLGGGRFVWVTDKEPVAVDADALAHQTQIELSKEIKAGYILVVPAPEAKVEAEKAKE